MSPSPAAHYILNFPSLQPQNSYLRLCGCASFSFSSRPCTGKRLGQGEGSIYLETEYLFHCISRHVGQQLWQLQCACLALWITCVHANQHQRKGKKKKKKKEEEKYKNLTINFKTIYLYAFNLIRIFFSLFYSKTRGGGYKCMHNYNVNQL